MERTDDARPEPAQSPDRRLRGTDALIPPRTVPATTDGHGGHDMRLTFAPGTPRDTLNRVLETVGMPAMPESELLTVTVVLGGITELDRALAWVASTFGEQVIVEVGPLGAFDADDELLDGEDDRG